MALDVISSGRGFPFVAQSNFVMLTHYGFHGQLKMYSTCTT